MSPSNPTRKSGGGRKSPARRPETWKAGVYVCPRCKNSVAILVKMTAPPVCANHKGGHPTVMEIEK